MDLVDFLFQLALILFTAKTLGILMRRLGLPQVLGFIISGILLGPAIWGMIFPIRPGALFPITESVTLSTFAEVGVIFVMFTAGLETDLKELKRTGLVSLLVALGGVLLPLAFGFLVGMIFMPGESWLSWLFIGVIITATSVGITVETLRELDKLKSKVGTVILSAAIIDDVLGLVVLSIALSLNGSNAGSSSVLAAINPNGLPLISILWMFVFFAVAVGVGYLLTLLFKLIEKKHPHTRRIPIYSLVVCLLYAFVAEKVFGVAEITGAYIAGVVLSVNHKSAEYVDRKITINSYMIFAPIFFANIGIKISFAGFNWHLLLFGIAFVVAAIAGKIIGCGGIAKMCGFGWKDSVRVGVGMIARGEVALIVATQGIEGGLIKADYLALVILLVLVSTIIAPIALKLLYKNDRSQPLVPFTDIAPVGKSDNGGSAAIAAAPNEVTAAAPSAVAPEAQASEKNDNGNGNKSS